MEGSIGRRALVVGVPTGLEVLTFEGGSWDHAVLVLPLPEWELPPGLTRSEREVARALLAGLRTAEIAARRGTTARTVSNQVQAIYQKLGVGSRVQLAARCARKT